MAEARTIDAIHQRVAGLVDKIPASECASYFRNAEDPST